MPVRVKHKARNQDGVSIDDVSLASPERDWDIFIQPSAGAIADTADHLVPLTLLASMIRNEPLTIEGSVSRRLAANLDDIQFILHEFGSSYGKVAHQIDVTLEASYDTPKYGEGRGVASFFTGGADSFYTVLTHRDEIDALIFAHGFDVPRRNKNGLRNLVTTRLHEAADALGLPLIEVDTNLRGFTLMHALDDYYQGSALATVGLALQPMFRKIYIPSTYSYRMLPPGGSHPLLDPLWSTENLEFVHDRLARRAEKVAYVSNFEVVQNTLRVCLNNPGGAYNCGECGKCLLTMLALSAVGNLEKVKTFDRPLNLDLVAQMPAASPYAHQRAVQYFEWFEEVGADPSLAEAVRASLVNAKSKHRHDLTPGLAWLWGEA